MSKSKTNTDVTRVTYRWDDQPGVEAGWYCQSFVGDELLGDSQKLWWFPDVEDFGEDEGEALAEALQEAFPNAEIVSI